MPTRAESEAIIESLFPGLLQMPVEEGMNAMFIKLSGIIIELKKENVELRARRDFLLESNNRLVEERRAAEAALAGKNVAIAVDPAERRTKVRDPRKDPQPGDVLSDCLGLHFVVQRQPELVTFIRPGWDTAHSISLRDWKKWTPKSTEVLHVAGE